MALVVPRIRMWLSELRHLDPPQKISLLGAAGSAASALIALASVVYTVATANLLSAPRVELFQVVPDPDNTYYHRIPSDDPDAGVDFYVACTYNLRLRNRGGRGAAITGLSETIFHPDKLLELHLTDQPYAEVSSPVADLESMKVFLLERPDVSLPLSAWEHPLRLEDLSTDNLLLVPWAYEFDDYATDIFVWTSFVITAQPPEATAPLSGPVDLRFILHLSTGESVTSRRVSCFSP
jgi:hypothetical protein